MDSTQTFLLLVAVPIVAWVGMVLLLRGAFQQVQRDWLVRGQTPPFSRIIVACAYGAVPVLFGLSLWLLSLSFADTLNAATSSAASDAEQLLLWASMTTAVAACCTVMGQAIVLRGRMSSYLGSDFGRVLPLSVIPFTETVFALVLALFVFRYIDGIAHGDSPAASTAVGSVVTAFQAFAVASLAVPVSAAVSNRVRDLSVRGFTRALIIADLGELPIVLGLVMGFLALGGL